MQKALPGIAAAFVVMAAPNPGAGQTWPNRPIHLIMPAPAGGNNDGIARLLAAGMSPLLGVTVVVENRTGAGGVPGTQYAASQKPDGHTLLFGITGAISITPYLRKLGYDPKASFTPISMVATTPMVLAVPKSFGTPDLESFIRKVKDGPGKYNYPSPGLGTILHVAMEALKFRAGLDIVHVPFPTVPMSQPLVAGQVQAAFDATISAAPHFESGALAGLAVTGPGRTATLPNVPTLTEKGFPGMEPMLAWMGLLAPAGTPPDIVARLNEVTIKVLGDPAIKDRILKLGAEPVYGSPAQMTKFLDESAVFWQGVIRDARITIES